MLQTDTFAAHRRVTNPLIPFCERWLPFLPGMRKNRARHARVYELYDDMLKQMEVGRSGPFPVWYVICDGVYSVAFKRRSDMQ